VVARLFWVVAREFCVVARMFWMVAGVLVAGTLLCCCLAILGCVSQKHR